MINFQTHIIAYFLALSEISAGANYQKPQTSNADFQSCYPPPIENWYNTVFLFLIKFHGV